MYHQEINIIGENLYEIRKYLDNQLHCEDEPAVIRYQKIKDVITIKLEDWYYNDKRHRINGPASTHFFKNEKIEYWFQNGHKHRVNGPSEIYYSIRDGFQRIICESYYYNNMKHRENGPAEIAYYHNGRVSREVWFYEGEKHRINNPAEIIYLNITTIETWYFKGVKHREGGPAETSYCNCVVSRETWFINGEQLNDNEMKIIKLTDLWNVNIEKDEYDNYIQYLPVEMLNITKILLLQ